MEDILSVEHVSHVGNKFSSKSTIGAMLVGSTIDNTVFGGPAYNAGQLEKGDQIVSVDGVVVEKGDQIVAVDDVTKDNLHDLLIGQDVTNENLHDLLVGQDVPGSVVKLHMRLVNARVTGHADAEARRSVVTALRVPSSDARKVLGEEVDVTLKRMATSVIADKNAKAANQGEACSV
ncbi:hypothetical protein T484DRAFT_1836191 [Baffinella frigidus]|nr:hypothetical protein T484DRAFT_1836191 [Cryptophyta sp. CCMP2293]